MCVCEEEKAERRRAGDAELSMHKVLQGVWEEEEFSRRHHHAQK